MDPMKRQRIILRHGGQWDKSEYIGGDEELFYTSMKLSLDQLIHDIHRVIKSDPSTTDYSLFYRTSMADGTRIKVALNCDEDLMLMLSEDINYPIVYAIEKNLESHSANDEDERPFSDDEDSNDEENEAIYYNELVESVLTEFNAWVRDPAHSRNFLNRTGLGDHNFSQSVETGPSCNIATQAGPIRNWTIPLADLDIGGPVNQVEPFDENADEIFEGALFASKDELEIVVGTYHLQNGVGYKVERSATDRVNYICRHGNGCPFMLRARSGANISRVIKFNPIHTCRTNFDNISCLHVTAKVMATHFSHKLVEGFILMPKDIIKEVKTDFGIEIDYSFALRVRNIAIEIVYGEYDKSYQMLPSYLYVLQQCNPRTVVDLQTNQDNLFKYMFLALGQCIDAFQSCLRPVIVVDGTHLKGKNKGILFVAVTHDGNEQVFPLAVGLGPIEDDESWIWFLSRVRGAFGYREGLIIVSDQHKSIKNAVEAVFPDAVHGLCYYHLSKNMACYRAHVLTIIRKAAFCYRNETFQKNMSLLEALSRDGAYRKLLTIGAHRWTRSQCPTHRFNFMTSNAAETLNARLLWARRLPVCSLLDVYRYVVEKWFDERRASASSRQHGLTDIVSQKLAKSMQLGRQITVRGTTTHVYKVEEDRKSYIVDLQQRTCDCREFDLDLIPCRHAAAVTCFIGRPVIEFVAHYYRQDTLLQTYSSHIMPMPHPDHWIIPSGVSSYIVRAPVINRQAGRQKMSRNRSAIESSSRRKYTCSRCHSTGHKKSVCNAHIPIEEIS